jgi:hypothetical protein
MGGWGDGHVQGTGTPTTVVLNKINTITKRFKSLDLVVFLPPKYYWHFQHL